MSLPPIRCLALLLIATLAATASAATQDVLQPAQPAWIGGIGGVYLLADPGELVIEIAKRDHNRATTRTELRAILAAPDRKVVAEAVIPDDGLPPGKPGPAQHVRLATTVARRGVYALNITVSGDRYGTQIVWCFRTNCRRWLIETSRGHRDARHEEPIVLDSVDHPGDVCFLPQAKAMTIDLEGLPQQSTPPTVLDANGKLLATLSVDKQGRAAHTFPAGPPREATPWRLHMAAAKGIVQIDGVTRWSDGDPNAGLSLWTPQLDSFFPFHRYRWIVSPYRRTLFGRPGETAQAKFLVHNNADRPRTIRLKIEFPATSWPASLSDKDLTLMPRQQREVCIQYTVPADGQTAECHLRATSAEDPDFSTYSTLTVTGGTAPATRPLTMPLVLKPYCHENEQFGYQPDYPLETQPYFDSQNRPFVRVGAGLATWEDGKWVSRDVRTAAEDGSQDKPLKVAAVGMRIAFDRQNHLYLPATSRGQSFLLDSADAGKHFSAWPLPGPKRSSGLEIEDFTGQNTADGPPPMLRYTQTSRDPRLIWRRTHDLELFIPNKTDGRVSFVGPVLVSRESLGLSAHSGIPSCVVSRDGRTHVVWAEATDPNTKMPGVPTYVATYDQQGNRLGEPALVGYGPPANDVHNTPSITIDSRGYLHVLVGTHGQPFPYARSLQPNTAHAGWTEPVPVGEGLHLTYIGLICGPDDTLHLVCRYWRFGEEPFPAAIQGTLGYLRKPTGGNWEPPRVLIVPPFSEYSVYYHRLTIDRLGRLFLSYDYYTTHWFYRTDHFGRRRSLLVSPDTGSTWKLAETMDLATPAK
jgi:hypothetical protein